jgi:hypothetical protein
MPSKCGAHEKNSRRDAQVSDRTRVDYHYAVGEELAAPNQRLWEKLPIETDAHRTGHALHMQVANSGARKRLFTVAAFAPSNL